MADLMVIDSVSLSESLTWSSSSNVLYSWNGFPHDHRTSWSSVKQKVKRKGEYNNNPACCQENRDHFCSHEGRNEVNPRLLFILLFWHLKKEKEKKPFEKSKACTSSSNSFFFSCCRKYLYFFVFFRFFVLNVWPPFLYWFFIVREIPSCLPVTISFVLYWEKHAGFVCTLRYIIRFAWVLVCVCPLS